MDDFLFGSEQLCYKGEMKKNEETVPVVIKISPGEVIIIIY